MSKLLWLPIDIPKFPISDLNLDTSNNWKFWNFHKLTNGYGNPYQVTDFTDVIKHLYPEIVEWFKFFPYRTIRNIKFNVQSDVVKRHIDFTSPMKDLLLYRNNHHNEPSGYRILLRGNRSEKLYVEDKGVKIYTTLPDTTDVYVLRHTDGMHGVEYDFDRTTIFTHFEIDAIKHEALIKRSLQKYKDFAIYSS